MVKESKKEPVRVAQIMGKLWAGGVENVVFNYYREVDKTKVQFDFFYDEDSTVEPFQELIEMGARFYKIPPYQKLPAYLKTLRRYLKKNKYSIVHSHINTLSIFPLFVAWQENIPVRIAHNHSVPGGNEFKRNSLKRFLKLFIKIFSTHYFACSEKAGRWMFGNKVFDTGQVFIMKNAIDFNRFRPSEEKINALKKELRLEDKFVIGHVGRFTYAKNHSFLLDIFRTVCNIRDDAMLLLVGDGELRNEIEKKICDLGLEKKVVLIGKICDPENYYRIANVMIYPSFFEGLPLTAIESQVAEVPVVFSNAIPDEAIISNGCKYLSLHDTSLKWAETAIEMSEKKVVLNDESLFYSIQKKAPILTEWYLSHV